MISPIASTGEARLPAAGDAMRSLLYTSGSPFARGVRILLDELGLDYDRNEALSVPGADDPASAPTLQVPILRDSTVTRLGKRADRRIPAANLS